VNPRLSSSAFTSFGVNFEGFIMLLLKLKLVRFTLPMCSQYVYVGTHWKCRLHGIIYLVNSIFHIIVIGVEK
jgi:hypothetical protein